MDAYILDAVRTPFGRYRGGLAATRTDDLAAAPLRELVRRNAGLDPALRRRRRLRQHQRRGRGEPQRRPDGRPARRPPGDGARLDREPAVRLRRGGRRPGRARPRRRRRALRGRGRGRGHEPRALRRAQARRGGAQDDGDAPDHRRLADGQPAFPGALDRLAGRLRGAGGRRARHRPRGAGRLGAAQPRARGRGVGQGPARRLRDAARCRHPRRVGAAGHEPGEARRPEARLHRRRHRDRGQLLADQRRRDRAAHGDGAVGRRTSG